MCSERYNISYQDFTYLQLWGWFCTLPPYGAFSPCCFYLLAALGLVSFRANGDFALMRIWPRYPEKIYLPAVSLSFPIPKFGGLYPPPPRCRLFTCFSLRPFVPASCSHWSHISPCYLCACLLLWLVAPA